MKYLYISDDGENLSLSTICDKCFEIISTVINPDKKPSSSSLSTNNTVVIDTSKIHICKKCNGIIYKFFDNEDYIKEEKFRYMASNRPLSDLERFD